MNSMNFTVVELLGLNSMGPFILAIDAKKSLMVVSGNPFIQ